MGMCGVVPSESRSRGMDRCWSVMTGRTRCGESAIQGSKVSYEGTETQRNSWPRVHADIHGSINNQRCAAKSSPCLCVSMVEFVLVKIMRNGFGFRNEQRQHAFGADGNDVILILKNSFDGEETLAGQQQAILMK